MKLFDKIDQIIAMKKAEELKKEIERIAAEKAKRYNYNKQWRSRNPLTSDEKAKRYEYHKKYNEIKKAKEREVLELARKLNLIK